MFLVFVSPPRAHPKCPLPLAAERPALSCQPSRDRTWHLSSSLRSSLRQHAQPPHFSPTVALTHRASRRSHTRDRFPGLRRSRPRPRAPDDLVAPALVFSPARPSASSHNTLRRSFLWRLTTMAYDPSSRDSSPLSSVPSTSPSPPPEFRSIARSPVPYPSPSSSKRSSAEASPVPENMSPTPASGDDAASPPRKRRKLEPKPRTTEHLDLRTGEVEKGQQDQLDRLLKVLHKKKKIVVIAGAGISVSAGSACSPRFFTASSR